LPSYRNQLFARATIPRLAPMPSRHSHRRHRCHPFVQPPAHPSIADMNSNATIISMSSHFGFSYAIATSVNGRAGVNIPPLLRPSPLHTAIIA